MAAAAEVAAVEEAAVEADAAAAAEEAAAVEEAAVEADAAVAVEKLLRKYPRAADHRPQLCTHAIA